VHWGILETAKIWEISAAKIGVPNGFLEEVN
jgi:hypothetical protein